MRSPFTSVYCATTWFVQYVPEAAVRDLTRRCVVLTGASRGLGVHIAQALAREGADLVLGSRYIPGGGTVNWNLFRQLISKSGSLYSQLVLGLPYRDLTGGFKCFRRQVLEAINLETVKSNGYAFQIELTYRAHERGFRIVELPITFYERRVGASKMSKDIVLEAMLMVWRLRFGRER